MPQPLKSTPTTTDMGSRGEWRFSQSFGDKTLATEDSSEVDMISAIEYDQSGDFLATGDSGGRIVIFSNTGHKKKHGASNLHHVGRHGSPQYEVYAEFQSHEAEFDYLKSLEIEEKINNIEWCRPSNNSLYLLSTNDKTIKLWRIHDKEMKVVTELNLNASQRQSNFSPHISTLKLPQLNVARTVVAATPRRIYANAHTYHINSIAANSDGETYLSSDDLRVNLWNLEVSNQSFNIVDIKPSNMEELTEVITASDFHPCHCNIMMYSSSKGSIKIGDMRQAALCDSQAKVLEEPEDLSYKSFTSEIIASISDVKFSPDGRYVVARDYLTIKIWDVNMESRPIQTIRIHEHLKPKLCELYENDCIFDKFECGASADGNRIVSGSYNNMFYIYERDSRTNIPIKAGDGKDWNSSNPVVATYNTPDVNNIDFSKKILHTAWHPHSSTVALAALNHLYIYSSDQKTKFLC